MAQIQTYSEQSIFKISKWLGVNENPDGDTQLKPGEATEMRNFRITQDGNLQLRPGMRTLHSSRAWSGPIRGIWHGFVDGEEYTVFAAGGSLWVYDFETNTAHGILKPGEAFTDAPAFFFGYSGKLYIMNGHEYFEWDGSMPPSAGAVPVAGYRPLTQVAVSPEGWGTGLEQINKLTGTRRVWFSPDGTARMFQLPEKAIKSVDYIKNLATGETVEKSAYTYDLPGGTIIFADAPGKGVNTIEVGYTHPKSFRAQVMAMRFAETYNGGTDNRVFIYGDGTSKSFYSGLDYDGAARADYFPDLNVLDIGSANTPITALIRHYDRLAVFKTDSAYSVQYGTIGLEDGRTTAAFYVTTANRSIGNIAPGQVELVENSPRTIFGSAVYGWRNYSSYSSNLTTDERQSKLISRRVYSSLSGMDLASAYTFDDNERQEYYVIQNGTAVVNSYATDTWFVYTNFNVSHLLAVGRNLYGCTTAGDIVSISRKHASDDGAVIDALWRSGSLAFGRDWQKKYVSRLFVTMKPEPKAYVIASIRTNKKAVRVERIISQGLASFSNANFLHWSFGVNRQPQTRRFKLKAKKLSYFQLVFESRTDWSTATILAADLKLKYAGDVR